MSYSKKRKTSSSSASTSIFTSSSSSSTTLSDPVYITIRIVDTVIYGKGPGTSTSNTSDCKITTEVPFHLSQTLAVNISNHWKRQTNFNAPPTSPGVINPNPTFCLFAPDGQSEIPLNHSSRDYFAAHMDDVQLNHFMCLGGVVDENDTSGRLVYDTVWVVHPLKPVKPLIPIDRFRTAFIYFKALNPINDDLKEGDHDEKKQQSTISILTNIMMHLFNFSPHRKATTSFKMTTIRRCTWTPANTIKYVILCMYSRFDMYLDPAELPATETASSSASPPTSSSSLPTSSSELPFTSSPDEIRHSNMTTATSIPLSSHQRDFSERNIIVISDDDEDEDNDVPMTYCDEEKHSIESAESMQIRLSQCLKEIQELRSVNQQLENDVATVNSEKKTLEHQLSQKDRKFSVLHSKHNLLKAKYKRLQSNYQTDKKMLALLEKTFPTQFSTCTKAFKAERLCDDVETALSECFQDGKNDDLLPTLLQLIPRCFGPDELGSLSPQDILPSTINRISDIFGSIMSAFEDDVHEVHAYLQIKPAAKIVTLITGEYKYERMIYDYILEGLGDDLCLDDGINKYQTYQLLVETVKYGLTNRERDVKDGHYWYPGESADTIFMWYHFVRKIYKSCITTNIDMYGVEHPLLTINTLDISKQQLHQLFRAKSLEVHPDRGGNGAETVDLNSVKDHVSVLATANDDLTFCETTFHPPLIPIAPYMIQKFHPSFIIIINSSNSIISSQT